MFAHVAQRAAAQQSLVDLDLTTYPFIRLV